MIDETAPATFVVYIRSRSAEAAASMSALNEQRAMLAAWLATQARAPAVVREFVEDENDAAGRPALADAVALCKVQGAALVIISTQPIGAGQPFEPRIASVPVTILPQRKRTPPAVIPLPAGAGDEVALYAARIQEGRIPVYLCNPKPVSLTDITVTKSGLYMAVERRESLIPFGGSARTFAHIEPQTAQLVETRNVMSEGESIDQRRVQFSEVGEVRQGVAYLSKLFDPRFIALKFIVVPKPERMSSNSNSPT